uniref:Uncharacterized protein n=1 Tax=Rhizochromulina marina TaxID=1034831 RepID=A0A7S2RLR1_9STRA|mmetsp:Transcript_18040/g.52707  ORF Transcript_18040/g.52707 Transcript_18040/m.52707 type:complete len:403 (+) Transcript_18040:3-1211(+)
MGEQKMGGGEVPKDEEEWVLLENSRQKAEQAGSSELSPHPGGPGEGPADVPPSTPRLPTRDDLEDGAGVAKAETHATEQGPESNAQPGSCPANLAAGPSKGPPPLPRHLMKAPPRQQFVFWLGDWRRIIGAIFACVLCLLSAAYLAPGGAAVGSIPATPLPAQDPGAPALPANTDCQVDGTRSEATPNAVEDPSREAAGVEMLGEKGQGEITEEGDWEFTPAAVAEEEEEVEEAVVEEEGTQGSSRVFVTFGSSGATAKEPETSVKTSVLHDEDDAPRVWTIPRGSHLLMEDEELPAVEAVLHKGEEHEHDRLITILASTALGLAGFAVGIPWVPGITDNVIVGTVLASVPVLTSSNDPNEAIQENLKRCTPSTWTWETWGQCFVDCSSLSLENGRQLFRVR